MKFAVVSVTAFPVARWKTSGLVYNLSAAFLVMYDKDDVKVHTPFLGVSNTHKTATACSVAWIIVADL